MTNRHEIALMGIDGSNPLGFLAAIGCLRTITSAWSDRQIAVSWRISRGAWRPVLHGIGAEESDSFLEVLNRTLKSMQDHPALNFSSDLVVNTETWRALAQQAQAAASPQDRTYADFIAAFACESIPRTERGMEEMVQDTALRTMSGTGHQHFLGFMDELVKSTELSHLQAALLHDWHYTDPGPSLRWDPNDDRRYALRWGNPSNSSKSPIRTVRGANRLAIEALPLLPTAPSGKKLATTGFTQRPGDGVYWSWPIWVVPLQLDPVRSLLALRDLQVTNPDRRCAAARGIAEIFRSQRITVGKYRNFTAAQPA